MTITAPAPVIADVEKEKEKEEKEVTCCQVVWVVIALTLSGIAVGLFVSIVWSLRCVYQCDHDKMLNHEFRACTQTCLYGPPEPKWYEIRNEAGPIGDVGPPGYFGHVGNVRPLGERGPASLLGQSMAEPPKQEKAVDVVSFPIGIPDEAGPPGTPGPSMAEEVPTFEQVKEMDPIMWRVCMQMCMGDDGYAYKDTCQAKCRDELLNPPGCPIGHPGPKGEVGSLADP